MNKRLSTLAFGSILFLCMVSPILGQKNKVDLQDRIVSIQMEKQALANILGYLMKEYEIPIGFEESILDREHTDYYFPTNLPWIGVDASSANGLSESETSERGFFETKRPITVKITNGKLTDVLDRIVGQMKNYKWEINDGVVNIYPIIGRDERFKDLLETNIACFNLAYGKTVDDISLTVLKLPEFGKWLHNNKLKFHPVRQGPVYVLDQQYGRTLDQGMSFSNLSFRQLLNEITKQKKGSWILKWKWVSANGEEHIDIDI